MERGFSTVGVNAMLRSSNNVSRYNKIGLDTNPFPLMPTPATARFISGKEQKSKFQAIVRSIERVKAGNTMAMGIIGDYGLGKSHMLKHMEYRLNEDPEMKPHENLVVYIHRPYDPREQSDLCYLCALICEGLDSALGEEPLPYLMQKLYSKMLVQSLESEKASELLQKGNREGLLGFASRGKNERRKNDLIISLLNDFRCINELEEEVDFIRLRTRVRDDIWVHFETRDANRPNYVDALYLEDMVDMFFEDRRQEAWGKISDRFRSSNNEARKFLKTLVNVSCYAGYQIVAILLDEIDQIPQQALHMLLGELTLFLEESGVKGPPPHMLFILSYTPKLELITSFYKRRIAVTVGLERMSKRDTKEMIVDYLNQARHFNLALSPFDDESLERIWFGCNGGDVGDVLKSCYWVVEGLADGIRLENAVSNVLKNEDVLCLQPSVSDTVELVRPTALISERVLEAYNSIETNAARSKKLEDSVRSLCFGLKGSPIGSTVIYDVAGTKRMLSTNGGKKRSRGIDVYLARHSAKGDEKLAIEVKIHGTDVKGYVTSSDLEGPFELVERKVIDRLIVFTITGLAADVLKRMKRFGNRVVSWQPDEDQLAQLLYSTNPYSFGRGLNSEEAMQVASDIGLLELLEHR
ncbi:MAG: hypothetical protein SVY53_12655 [Chloroflexota bacterium]|nr:hypothetical protein [Chloroflexota bacterium]